MQSSWRIFLIFSGVSLFLFSCSSEKQGSVERRTSESQWVYETPGFQSILTQQGEDIRRVERTEAFELTTFAQKLASGVVGAGELAFEDGLQVSFGNEVITLQTTGFFERAYSVEYRRGVPATTLPVETIDNRSDLDGAWDLVSTKVDEDPARKSEPGEEILLVANKEVRIWRKGRVQRMNVGRLGAERFVQYLGWNAKHPIISVSPDQLVIKFIGAVPAPLKSVEYLQTYQRIPPERLPLKLVEIRTPSEDRASTRP